MTDNFVGFARSPKQSKTAQLQMVSSVCQFSVPAGEVVKLFSTAEGVASWLAELTTPAAKWRFQLGVKLKFQDAAGEFGATFGAINLPSELVLLTERFGEIQLKLPAPKRTGWLARFNRVATNQESNGLTITVTRMCEPAEIADWQSSANALLERFTTRLTAIAEVPEAGE